MNSLPGSLFLVAFPKDVLLRVFGLNGGARESNPRCSRENTERRLGASENLIIPETLPGRAVNWMHPQGVLKKRATTPIRP